MELPEPRFYAPNEKDVKKHTGSVVNGGSRVLFKHPTEPDKWGMGSLALVITYGGQQYGLTAAHNITYGLYGDKNYTVPSTEKIFVYHGSPTGPRIGRVDCGKIDKERDIAVINMFDTATVSHENLIDKAYGINDNIVQVKQTPVDKPAHDTVVLLSGQKSTASTGKFQDFLSVALPLSSLTPASTPLQFFASYIKTNRAAEAANCWYILPDRSSWHIWGSSGATGHSGGLAAVANGDGTYSILGTIVGTPSIESGDVVAFVSIDGMSKERIIQIRDTYRLLVKVSRLREAVGPLGLSQLIT